MPNEVKQGKLVEIYRELKNSDSEEEFVKRKHKFDSNYEREHKIQIGRRKLKQVALENDILKQFYNKELPIYINEVVFLLVLIVGDDMVTYLRKKVLDYERLDINTFDEVVEDLNILLPNLLRYLEEYSNNIWDSKKKEVFLKGLERIGIGLIKDAVYTSCDADNKEMYEM